MSSSGGLLNVERTLHCLKCGAHTTHKLETYSEGCRWTCGCGDWKHARTNSEMVTTVLHKCFGLPPKAPDVPYVPPDLRVYLRYDGPEDASEIEVDSEVIDRHIKLTGKIPVVGEPLFGAPMALHHPGIAVPFGEVVRVEVGKESNAEDETGE